MPTICNEDKLKKRKETLWMLNVASSDFTTRTELPITEEAICGVGGDVLQAPPTSEDGEIAFVSARRTLEGVSNAREVCW